MDLAFVAGVIMAETLQRPSAAMVLDIGVLLVVGALPSSVPARAFTTVIAAFLLGVMGGGYFTLRFGTPAVWGAAFILTAGLMLFIYDDWLDTGGRERNVTH